MATSQIAYHYEVGTQLFFIWFNEPQYLPIQTQEGSVIGHDALPQYGFDINDPVTGDPVRIVVPESKVFGNAEDLEDDFNNQLTEKFNF